MRRRQHLKAALAAAAAVAVCGALLGLPGDGWAPDGAAAPAYAQNPAAEAALDPARLIKVPAAAWKSSARTDFSVWPARGDLTGDSRPAAPRPRRLGPPRRDRPGLGDPRHPVRRPRRPAPAAVRGRRSTTARVVILYDGLRIVRYAEPKDGTSGAALDFARVDGATGAEADAVVLDRADGNVRYLTAPWVRRAADAGPAEAGRRRRWTCG